MSGPGSGRYTTFVPVKGTKNTLLKSIYNDSYGSKADIYQGSKYFDNISVATEAKNKYLQVKKSDVKSFSALYGGSTVSLSYQDAPDVASVKFKTPGDPANPYVPDISSPGAGKTDPKQKDVDPEISIKDVKPNFDVKHLPPGEENPVDTSKKLAHSILTAGKNVEFGKSLSTTEK